jgi:hypothetical protein
LLDGGGQTGALGFGAPAFGRSADALALGGNSRAPKRV